jgi:ParB family transcriptional regulator, chromosome partitioning protein
MQKTLKKMSVNEITPYENNPRNNENAIEAVMESIRQCEYVAPIIVDENGVILAGHTRYEALKRLGQKEIEVMVATGLSDEQKRKYRLLDNKTNEFAEWDYDLLAEELDDLDFGEFDFGFELIDDSDNLENFFNDAPTPTKEKETKTKIIKCPKCGEEFEVEEG